MLGRTSLWRRLLLMLLGHRCGAGELNDRWLLHLSVDDLRHHLFSAVQGFLQRLHALFVFADLLRQELFLLQGQLLGLAHFTL